MQGDDPRSKETTNDRQIFLKEQRSSLLEKIDRITHDSPSLSATENQLRELKHEYNKLVEEENSINPSPFSDPLERLPPELWPSIMPDNLDDILILILVSHRWRYALISSPKLWSTVFLDDASEDYFAKAALCLHLSRPMEIELHISLTLALWQEVAPIFLPEAPRIRRLSFHGRRSLTLDESLSILAYFGTLSALKYLNLPLNQGLILCYGESGFLPLDDSYYPPDSFPFSHLPSVQCITDLSYTSQLLKKHYFAKLETVKIQTFDKDMAVALAELPSLRYLHFDEENFVAERDDLMRQVTLRSSWPKPAVYSLLYYGLFLVRTLQCIGDTLVDITATVNVHDITELLDSLSRFPALAALSLDIDFAPNQHTGRQAEAYSLDPTNIRTVRLRFVSQNLPRRGYGDTDQGIHQAIEANSKLFSSVFSTFARVIPFSEAVEVADQFFAEAAFAYTRGLKSLRSLIFLPRAPGGTQFKSKFLPILGSPYELPINFLDQVSHHALDHLEISNPSRPYLSSHQEDMANEVQDLLPFTISSHRIQSVQTLKISITHPLLFDLSIFSSLKAIHFHGGHMSATWASDFLEEMAIRPNMLPFLDFIALRGILMEWDILFLMLERRNVCIQSGVSRIKTLEVDTNLPYRLLYPITQLLQGKFADIPSLDEFSIVTIGKRLWDPSAPGCRRCICMFNACSSPVSDGRVNEYWDEEKWIEETQYTARILHQYQLPTERLAPDPPLSPRLTLWLEGRRARRQTYAERYKENIGQVNRLETCGLLVSSSYTIDGYSLNGAYFEE